MRTYTDLIIWKEAVALAIESYSMTSTFHITDAYGLGIQMRRAAVSIPSNIAEGYGRYTKREFGRFISIALGSLYEFQTQLLIAKEIGFIEEEVYNSCRERTRQLQARLLKFKRTLVGTV